MSSGGTHMQLGVIRNKAMVVCKCSDWTLIVVELPTCTTLYEVTLSQVSTIFDCHQIRSYKQTAMILFACKQNDTWNIIVTVDVVGGDHGGEVQLQLPRCW